MMTRSEYNVAVHGVPLSYYGGPVDPPEVPRNDEEWCIEHDFDHDELMRATVREEAGI